MGSYTAAFILVTLSVLFTVIQSQEHIRIKRRMYAMCPPKFQRIGSECYAISDQPANWLEAHFQCKDKNSKLAEPNNRSDRKLRAFFQRMDHDSDEIWIGATFDWHINTWQWSISGKNLSYDAFSRLDPESRQNLEYHCAVLNPSLKYRWSARSCVDKHRYICQHKMPKVSEKNRFKVYNRWNQTFPNQLANEVELEVIDTKTKDGVRTHRRVKPMDSSENYPMPLRRPSQPEKQRRRPYVPSRETDNEVNVKFIPNYITNEINGGVSYQTPVPATVYPLSMDFIPANNDVQAAQAYMDTTTKRSRNPTNTPSSDNETVDQVKQPTSHGKRVKTTFDKLNEEKRRLEREKKRAEHRRRKQMRLRNKQEEERKKQEDERKKLEEERKKQDEERRNQEAERKRQEQAAIDELKLKQAEEEKQVKEQEEATLAQRQKLEAQREKDKKEKERQEEEAKLLQEKREEEEDRLRKQRLHEENRLRLEYEERMNKEQQTERERKLEEEKRVAEENRRRLEQEERARQEELKRLQEEDEKRLELQRMEIDRKRQEEELARLEEENRKRIAAQKKREEEIRRREEALTAQLDEEKRLQEELRIREEQDRLLHDQEIQREIEEKKQKEEAERLELERKEEIRKQKEKKLREKIDIEAQNLEKEEERKKKEKIRKYAERISRLSPEMQKKFMEARKNRKKNHKNSDNEVSIPERK